jgi:hypothetical protein
MPAHPNVQFNHKITPRSHNYCMSQQYTVNQPLTISGLVALANSTRADSNPINNTVTQYDAFDIAIQIKLGSGGVNPGGNIIFGFVRSVDGGATYESSPEQLLTVTGLSNSEQKSFSMRLTGVPAFFKVTVRNNSGASFDSTGGNFSSIYTGVTSPNSVAGHLSPAHVNVATSATLLLAANPTRHSLAITNAGGATVFIGGASVTTGTGLAILNNSSLVFSAFSGDAVYGIVAAGTNAVSVMDW